MYKEFYERRTKLIVQSFFEDGKPDRLRKIVRVENMTESRGKGGMGLHH